MCAILMSPVLCAILIHQVLADVCGEGGEESNADPAALYCSVDPTLSFRNFSGRICQQLDQASKPMRAGLLNRRTKKSCL